MRTYYVIEMGWPSYPVNELRVSERRPADPVTAEHAHRVRASNRVEAERLVRDRLSSERLAVCQEQLS